MGRHLLKLVWNRRRTSALLVLEIFFSFLATLIVATLALYCWDNYRRPVGFEYRNVWAVQIQSLRRHFDQPPDKATYIRIETLLREARALPEVVAAAATTRVPYETGEDRSSFRTEQGKRVLFSFCRASLDIDQVLETPLAAGRWFRRGDEALGWQPVVVNEALADQLYPNRDPIGQRFGKPDPKNPQEPERRIIGVVSEYREGGELAGTMPYAFLLQDPAAQKDTPYSTLVLRVRPGTPAIFEVGLLKRLQAVAPEWSFSSATLEGMRDTSFRVRLAALIAGGLIAAFLLAMIGLGMVGVVWQNLLRRTQEIGLRRAAGASRSAVRKQIVLEQLLITTIGMATALVLVVQLPILGLIDFLSMRVFVGGVLLSMFSIYLLVAMSSFHPSLLASRLQPAEALRYE
jgi:putative ABC transport system permease protein